MELTPVKETRKKWLEYEPGSLPQTQFPRKSTKGGPTAAEADCTPRRQSSALDSQTEEATHRQNHPKAKENARKTTPQTMCEHARLDSANPNQPSDLPELSKAGRVRYICSPTHEDPSQRNRATRDDDRDPQLTADAVDVGSADDQGDGRNWDAVVSESAVPPDNPPSIQFARRRRRKAVVVVDG
ncbi:unnamed protein product [Linum trigynum]|uniref:Uncharacterized protein n=1 Tax=Linum trigynum TaxID=586398 RepID=A0AAV2D027_9ROSI